MTKINLNFVKFEKSFLIYKKTPGCPWPIDIGGPDTEGLVIGGPDTGVLTPIRS